MAWLLALMGGCATVVSSAVQGVTDDLAGAILNSEDVDLVRDGAPAYLILIDGLVEGSPDDPNLLKQAAQLNSAYASAFVDDQTRAQRMHAKALELSMRSVCLSIKGGCDLDTRPYGEFESWLAERKPSDADALYGLGATWAGWLQVNTSDFNAIAQVARVKSLMQRVRELDEGLDNGGVYLYLGVFETLFPPAMGGKPELGREHFERALALSEGKNLLAAVMFAESYARLVFDRELHDELLTDVVAADAKHPGLTLMNTVAKSRAKELLDSADEFF